MKLTAAPDDRRFPIRRSAGWPLPAAGLAAAALILGACAASDRDWAAGRCQAQGRGQPAAELEGCIAEQLDWLEYNRFRARTGRP